MASLTQANLTDAERSALDRFVELARRDLGDDLHAVWLYGSRARGEGEIGESDVDLLVITARGREDGDRLAALTWEAREAAGDIAILLSMHVHTPEWLEGRREIESFFIQEVDRDKIALYGGS